MNRITFPAATLAAVLSAPACAQWHPGAINRIITSAPGEDVTAPSAERVDDAWVIGGVLWTPSPSEPIDLESETEVDRRAREARERTNQRWLERRARERHPIEPGPDGRSSGWFGEDRRPDPLGWPWWLW